MESVGKSQVVLEVNFDCMEIFVIIEFVMRSTERKKCVGFYVLEAFNMYILYVLMRNNFVNVPYRL